MKKNRWCICAAAMVMILMMAAAGAVFGSWVLAATAGAQAENGSGSASREAAAKNSGRTSREAEVAEAGKTEEGIIAGAAQLFPGGGAEKEDIKKSAAESKDSSGEAAGGAAESKGGSCEAAGGAAESKGESGEQTGGSGGNKSINDKHAGDTTDNREEKAAEPNDKENSSQTKEKAADDEKTAGDGVEGPGSEGDAGAAEENPDDAGEASGDIGSDPGNGEDPGAAGGSPEDIGSDPGNGEAPGDTGSDPGNGEDPFDPTEEPPELPDPEIHIRAYEEETGSQVILFRDGLHIVAELTYSGLPEGGDCFFTAVLMDAETGQPFTDRTGRLIEAETRIDPQESDGILYMTLSMDDTEGIGRKAVVFSEAVIRAPLVKAESGESEDPPGEGGSSEPVDPPGEGGNSEPEDLPEEGGSSEPADLSEEGGSSEPADPSEEGGSSEPADPPGEGTDGNPDPSGADPDAGSPYTAERIVTVNTDTEKEACTIWFPRLEASACDQRNGTRILSAGVTTVTDSVTCDHLKTGETYLLTGTLVNRSDGTPVLYQGIPVKAEKTFSPETEAGREELVLGPFGPAEGDCLAVFEELTLMREEDGTRIAAAEHHDLKDPGQTLSAVRMTAFAADKKTGSKNMYAGKQAAVADTVRMENLIPGVPCTLKGTLMDAAAGEPVMIGGAAVTAEKTITPDGASCTAELEFGMDASALAGRTLTVFQSLYIGNVPVGIHENIEDQEQSVYVPEIRTEAADSLSGTHRGERGAGIRICDTVTYSNLIPGTEYMLRGTLVDNETGSVMMHKNGTEITAETIFTAKASVGSITLEFPVEQEALQTEEVVVFEELLLGGRMVAQHKDRKDERQKVIYPIIAAGADTGADGNGSAEKKDGTALPDGIAELGDAAGTIKTAEGSGTDKDKEKSGIKDQGDGERKNGKKDKADSADKTGKKDKADSTDKTGKKDKADSADKTGKKDKTDSTDKTRKKNKTDSADETGKKDKAGSAGETGKKDKAEGADKAGKKEKAGTEAGAGGRDQSGEKTASGGAAKTVEDGNPAGRSAPATGDRSEITAWVILFLTAVILLAALIRLRGAERSES